MLSLFPELYDWSWYVPLVFRLFLGIYLLYIGWEVTQTKSPAENEKDRLTWKLTGALLALFGLLFFCGIYIQPLGSTGFVLAMLGLFLRSRNSPHAKESRVFYLLIGLVSLSLVFLGPGPYAFDLPL